MMQSIYLNQQGQVVFSCDQLFVASSFSPGQLMDLFPLLESIFPSILLEPRAFSPMYFPGVQREHPPLVGIFDFHFWVIGSQTMIIHWQIQDLTEQYWLARKEQQKTYDRYLER